MRKASILLILLTLISACGRDPGTLYRSYNLTPIQDKDGNIQPDLATQNRQSMQTSGNYSYFYVAPNHDEPASESTETADSDATLPGDVATATDTPEPTDPLAAAKAGLAELADTLETLIRNQEKNKTS